MIFFQKRTRHFAIFAIFHWNTVTDDNWNAFRLVYGMGNIYYPWLFSFFVGSDVCLAYLWIHRWMPSKCGRWKIFVDFALINCASLGKCYLEWIQSFYASNTAWCPENFFIYAFEIIGSPLHWLFWVCALIACIIGYLILGFIKWCRIFMRTCLRNWASTERLKVWIFVTILLTTWYYISHYSHFYFLF